jgi:hypothetical protein
MLSTKLAWISTKSDLEEGREGEVAGVAGVRRF